MKPTTEEIEAAMQVILAAGKTAYIDPDLVGVGSIFGMGVFKSHMELEETFLLDAAIEELEQHNYHAEVKQLRAARKEIFPHLFA